MTDRDPDSHTKFVEDADSAEAVRFKSGEAAESTSSDGLTWQSALAAGKAAGGRARRPIQRFLTLALVPLTASFLSLILSVAAIFISSQQPEVLLVVPDQIRIAQGRQSGSAFVYLQPAFVSTGRNERVEVIRDMTLSVQSSAGTQTDFSWTEQVRLVGDSESTGLSYEYAGDAVPLLVSARTASSPVGLFDAPDGFFFAAGTYTFTLMADRVVAADGLRATFTVTISADDITFLDESGTNRFLTFPIS